MPADWAMLRSAKRGVFDKVRPGKADLQLPTHLRSSRLLGRHPETGHMTPWLSPDAYGRPRKWPLRRIVEAILYLLRGGLPWRMLPPYFPPVSTVRRWFYLWRDNGLWLSLNHALLLIGREAVGRYPSGEGRTRFS